MKENNIIFVGGIHGVGKTTLCKGISSNFQIEYITASDLISKLYSEKIKRDKKVEDINDNQDILIRAVNKFVDKDKNYLLDGHLCLLDNSYEIKRIPLETFDSLNLKGMVILYDNVEEIFNRLENRDENKFSLIFLKEFQEQELNYGEFVCNKLNIPFHVFSVSQGKLEFEKVIKNILY